MNHTELQSYLKKSLKLAYDDPSVTFSWEITSTDNNLIKIKLNFDNPLLIKQNDVNFSFTYVILGKTNIKDNNSRPWFSSVKF